MKGIFRIAAPALLCLAVLVSCSRQTYTDTLSCGDLGEEIITALGDGQEYLDYDSLHREYYFEDTEEYDDCRLIYSSDTNDINEIGIFHAPDAGKAAELEETCRDYIKGLREDSRDFIASYAPEELPKLDGAQVRRYGNYVVYTVLPSQSTEDVLSLVEEMLTEK